MGSILCQALPLLLTKGRLHLSRLLRLALQVLPDLSPRSVRDPRQPTWDPDHRPCLWPCDYLRKGNRDPQVLLRRPLLLQRRRR